MVFSVYQIKYSTFKLCHNQIGWWDAKNNSLYCYGEPLVCYDKKNLTELATLNFLTKDWLDYFVRKKIPLHSEFWCLKLWSNFLSQILNDPTPRFTDRTFTHKIIWPNFCHEFNVDNFVSKFMITDFELTVPHWSALANLKK